MSRSLNHSSRALIALVLIAVALSLFISGCSKSAGGNALHLKTPNTGEKDLAVKSSYTFAVTKSFTDINGKITTATSNRTYVANYDLDAGNFAMTMDKPLTSDEQVRVAFSLVGEEGSNDKTTPKAGTYSAKADKYMKVEDVTVISRKGGSDARMSLDRNTVNGEVKVTSASADSISGDIDLTSGEMNLKGSFTAKVLKRK
jgi:hypothetical protein